MSIWLQTNPSTLVMGRGEAASVLPGGRECRISCVAGRVWATISGCAEDTVLEPGNESVFTGEGRIVVEALRAATVRVELRAASPLKSGACGDRERLPAGLLQQDF